MGTAFQITEDDVCLVIERNIERYTGDKTQVDAVAAQLLDELDHDQAERTALDGGVDMDDQTDAAQQNIAEQLQSLGYLLPVPQQTPKH